MALFKSGNPTLGNSTFQKLSNSATSSSDVMTLDGTVNKTITLLILLISNSIFSWWAGGAMPQVALPLMIGGAIGGLICAIVLAFNKTLSPMLAPAYALCEGLFLGIISKMYESFYDGIVLSAIVLTFGIAFCLLMIYKMRIIKVTENFKLIVSASTAGIALFYLAAFILGFFGIRMPLIHDNGIFGIIFSLVVVGIASANLVMDFDFIEQGAEMRVPKYMEWYGAFGLMVTLVWLYLEILRLLSKLRSR